MEKRVTPLRKFLSYGFNISLERVDSPFNGPMEVILADGRCMLNTAHATYSYEEKYTSFSKALRTIAADIPSRKSILMLGLGLGSVPLILQTQYNCQAPITCVEIDPAIIRLAKKYYPYPAGLANMTLVQADAVEWVTASTQQFDLVIADVFLDAAVPQSLHSTAFLERLRRLTAPGGILLFSRLLDRQRFERPLWDHLDQIFPEATQIDTGGNVVLCFRNT
ncbi:MAG TPA: fused MFS/spermidine synthase [Chitinophagales bacterium]|nr:fused MFS/spermidine synthase [Chitinophagales bacterium]